MEILDVRTSISSPRVGIRNEETERAIPQTSVTHLFADSPESFAVTVGVGNTEK